MFFCMALIGVRCCDILIPKKGHRSKYSTIVQTYSRLFLVLNIILLIY